MTPNFEKIIELTQQLAAKGLCLFKLNSVA